MKNQKGFAAIETFLIILVIALIGGVAWYVVKQNKNINESSNSTNSSGQSVEKYVPASTVPKDWKTYNSEPYKISFAYPNDWGVRVDTIKKNKMDDQNVYSNNAQEVIIFGIHSPKAVQYSDVLIEAFKQQAEQSVEQMKAYYDNLNKNLSEGEKPTVFSSKAITFQGKKGYKTTTKQTLGSGDVVTTVKYFVEANGYTFALPEIDTGHSVSPATTKNANYVSQVIQDSIKFL